jgi:hypothetical protein
VHEPRDPLPAVDGSALAGVQRGAERADLRQEGLVAQAGDLGVPGVDQQLRVRRPQPRREPLVGDGHATAEHHRGSDVLVDRGGHHLVEPEAGLRPDPVEPGVAEPAL